MFSDFLNINEQSLFKREISKMPPVSFEALGGYNLAERTIIEFTPLDSTNVVLPPIVTILIKPLNAKFADTLSHRDFLGAILNLGIDRSKVGDIVVILGAPSDDGEVGAKLIRLMPAIPNMMFSTTNPMMRLNTNNNK